MFLAICDGILNNDAFKHNSRDANNNTWTQLLKEFKFYSEIENHVQHLRERFVLGAADWLAGNNGSLRNDKEILGYGDNEWHYIWMTMIKDGAWAVPAIKDSNGKIIKENHAPELLIKFIAHDLKCHIIVFDLLLNRIQFVSGNHLRLQNVIFESPLLMYATGGHFQAVFPDDHDFFINYARQLELENQGILPNIEGNSHQAAFPVPLVSSIPKIKSDQVEKRHSVAIPVQELSSGEEVISDLSFETIRNIRQKDRTPEQQRIFDKLSKGKKVTKRI